MADCAPTEVLGVGVLDDHFVSYRGMLMVGETVKN
jgi:hypothetical protein